jgi:metallo-beta-lactamase class B
MRCLADVPGEAKEMRPQTKRRRWVILGLAIVLVAVAATAWRSAIHANRQMPFEPFRIAGNLYYVGTPDVTAFLLTGPEGHVLIDIPSPHR